MRQVTFAIRLGLLGPVLSRATAMGAIGIDAPMARDSHGQYYLPFSLIKGRLRQAWQEINEATGNQLMPPGLTLNDLLGVSSDEPHPDGSTDYDPRRGSLQFTDFQYQSEAGTAGTIHRIRMDVARGAADDGAMQVIESPFAPGQHVHFHGEVHYIARDEDEADAVRGYLHAGLRWISNLGGERTTGFGRLVEVAIESRENSPVQSPSHDRTHAAETFDIAVRPLGLFCVSKRPIAPNLFESDIVLAGRVIRGTLAATLKRLVGRSHHEVIDDTLPAPWEALGTYFNDIRFTHCFPARESENARPVVPPLSLVKDVKTWYDVALCEGPMLLGDPPRAPLFAIDWKSSSDVDSGFGWPESNALRYELRVRTEMDRQMRRAKDQQLFAYDMVIPDGLRWYGRVDLRQVPEGETRRAVAEQLQRLLQDGLQGIGKTKVSATVAFDAEYPAAHASHSQLIMQGEAALWVVTLQSPALLCDPALLDETSDDDALKRAYAQVWSQLSYDHLQLVRYFAAQSLAGGYQVLRFQAGKPYHPFVLTNAGSVFVLRAQGDREASEAYIRTWLQQGVPLPAWAQTRYGHDWRTCPFLPEDGFGEIAVNLPCHTERQARGEVLDAI